MGKISAVTCAHVLGDAPLIPRSSWPQGKVEDRTNFSRLPWPVLTPTFSESVEQAPNAD